MFYKHVEANENTKLYDQIFFLLHSCFDFLAKQSNLQGYVLLKKPFFINII